ncbi:MAG: AAA family ATPase [Chloroflexi bacterium]|nr:AAA family ATPase [Chloroflexota bacterium]
MVAVVSLASELLRPEVYPTPPGPIELVQTHLSLVFVTERYAYKVKKPVNFGFVDYTTVERRRYFCRREVDLNRRLCPDMYLGVAAIYQDPHGQLRLTEPDGEPPGTVVDYAVVMCRLPAQRMMDVLLAGGKVTEGMVAQIASCLARFHAEAETNEQIAVYGHPEAIGFNWEENFQQTKRYFGNTVFQEQFDAISAYAEGFLGGKRGLFLGRMERGRVRDGHGDLHSANVCFGDNLYIYDCIEFNERFRYLDVASDVAFMAMDLDFYGRPDLSRAFAEQYIRESGDDEVAELLPFYKCYRAYVRGKVESFPLEDPLALPEARERACQRAGRYFRLAHSYTRRLERPTVVITVGLIGTGKSTLARALAHRTGMEVVSSDEVRKRLQGLSADERRLEPFQGGIYSAEVSRLTYDEMFRQAGEVLAAGRSVLLDASFRRAEERARAVEVARAAGADFWAIECVASEATIRERLERRARDWPDASDARWELFPQIKGEHEPVREIPSRCHLVVDCSGLVGDALDTVVSAITN